MQWRRRWRKPRSVSKYAQVSYETLVRMRRELKHIFGPCNERLMLKAMRLYGAFATLDVRFSNDKLLSMGMPKLPRFTDYIARCVQTTQGLNIPAANGGRFQIAKMQVIRLAFSF